MKKGLLSFTLIVTLFCFSIIPNKVEAWTTHCETSCKNANSTNNYAYEQCRNSCNNSVCNSVSANPQYSFVKTLSTCNNTTGYGRDQCLSTASNSYSSYYKKNNSSYNKCLTSCQYQGSNCIANNCNSEHFYVSSCYKSYSKSYSSIQSSVSASISKEESASNSQSKSWANGGYEINYGSSPCENENIKLGVKVIGRVVSIIQIAAPIILVIMACVDLAKQILTDNDSHSRKNMTTLIKRIISAIIIFFIIAIIKLVCGLVGNDSVDTDCLKYISNPW